MNTEFSIDLNGALTKIYMQVGFFDHEGISYPLHAHPLTEMHILLHGTAKLKCNDAYVLLEEGDVVCIPPDAVHGYSSSPKDVKRCTFFIERENEHASVRKITFCKTLIALLCREIERYVFTGNDHKLKPLLSYICSDFFEVESKKTPVPLSNRQLIVDDFFQNRYHLNVTLEDLARELMLGTKQTEREVKRITGRTFKGELLHRRIQAAVILSKTTDYSLSEIASLVGYASYSGFFKAFKRYLEEQSHVADP